MAATGNPVFLWIISGGMSIPPVDAPAWMTNPIPAPISNPANTVQSMGSVVRTPTLVESISPILKKKVYTKVLTSVVMANFFPRNNAPRINMVTLKIVTKVLICKPV